MVAHAAWIEDFLVKKRAPKYPFPIDAQAAAHGKALFDANCNSCHGLGPGTRVGTVIDVHEVGTDDNRLVTWTQQAADIANQTVATGVKRIGLVKTNGYQAVPLDGIWLRAPTCTTVRYRTCGNCSNRWRTARRFSIVATTLPSGQRRLRHAVRRGSASAGFKVDTSVKGNGNQEHLYGTTLALAEKTALIEYLKTLGPNEGDSQ